jgi:secretion/DNA translocation related TadE-like protein
VWAAALLGLVVLVVLAGIARGVAVVARHQTETAADLSALAAAGVAGTGQGDACDAAARVAVANGAWLADCRLSGSVVEVTVQKTLTAGRLGRYRVAARARAGPAGQGSGGDVVSGASATPGPSSGH